MHDQETGRGLSITLHMSHEEIARNIGSSRESVSRILSDWKQRGVVLECSESIIIPCPKEFRETTAPARSR
jgi:CRP-like cAMP-binding protein